MSTTNLINSRFKTAVEHAIDAGLIKNKTAVAAAIGISKSKLSEILNDRMNVSAELISDFCTAVPNISSGWILMGVGEVFLSNLEADIKKEIDRLDERYTNYQVAKRDQMPKVVTVDKSGNDNIVLVPVKAAAGYMEGYGDPKYIQTLPTYHLPNIQHGTFRMFQVNGHSMFPTLHDNAFVVGQWIENWFNDIKDDRIYVVVSKNDGVVVKRVLNRLEKYGNLYCKSDNRREYPSFQVETKDILEVWEVKMGLLFDLPNPADLYDRMNDLEAEILHLKGAISTNTHDR